MQFLLNKKVVLLLCFTINIVQFIECATESNEHVSEAAQESAVKDSIGVTESAINAKYEAIDAVPKSEHAKNMRNIGGVQHNYRSSYVGNRLNRRVGTAAKQVEVATTEQIPIIKAKRKFDNDFSEEIKYNVGPGVNIGVEKEKELVSVYLDEDCLKDVFTGKTLTNTHTFYYRIRMS